MQTARARSTATDNRMLTAMAKDRQSRRHRRAAGDMTGSMRPRGYLPVAGLISLLGGFVTAAGAGSGNGFVAAIGLGMLISAAVYAGFAAARRRIASMVPGTAHVVSAGAPPGGATHGRCEMHVVVQAPKLTATAVRHRDSSVPVAKWPTPGGTLPVLVNPQDPRELKIRWDKVSTHGGGSTTRGGARPEQPRPEPVPATADLDDQNADRTAPPTQAPSPSTAADETAVDSPLKEVLDAVDGEPVDLSFLEPPQFDSLLESDPLLMEYGSPVREVGITLLVADLKQSLEFYRDVLGFFEIESGPDVVLLEARTGRLVLRQNHHAGADAEVGAAAGAGAGALRSMHLTLEVNDIEATHRVMTKRGVEFLEEPRVVFRGETLELWAAPFRDPDGHDVSFTSWQPRGEETEDA